MVKISFFGAIKYKNKFLFSNARFMTGSLFENTRFMFMNGIPRWPIYGKEVIEGNDQEKAQLERDSYSKKLNNQVQVYTMKTY